MNDKISIVLFSSSDNVASVSLNKIYSYFTHRKEGANFRSVDAVLRLEFLERVEWGNGAVNALVCDTLVTW